MRLSIPSTLLILLLALPGCSTISALGQASATLQIYELRTPALTSQAGRRRNVELVIEEPVASGALATERIMIRPGPLQAQYLPGARWADPAPAMLQTLLLRSFAESAALGSVGRRPVGTIGDYALLSELTDFQAEATSETGTTEVRLRLIVRLVNERSSRVLATRTFSVTEAATSSQTEPVVAAFDRASARLIGEIVPWVLARLGAG